MKVILALIKKEFKQLKEDKRLLVMSFVPPIFMFIIFSYAATMDVKNIEMAVCDYDRSAASRELLDRFVTSGYFLIATQVNSEDELDPLLDRGTAKIGLVIPPDFSKKINAQRNTKVQVLVDGTDGNSANISLAYANVIINSYNQAIQMDLMKRNNVQLKVSRILPEIRVWFNPEVSTRTFMIPVLIAMVLLVSTTMATSIAVVKEKERGTLEQLIVTTIKPYQLIAGKLIPFAIIGLIDITIILILAMLLFDLVGKGNLVFMYLMICIYLLNTLSLGLLVSTLVKSQQQAALFTMFLIMLPFIYLSGFVFPIENMPVALQAVTYLVPLRYFAIIIRSVFLKGAGWAELWPNIVVLTIFGFGLFFLAVKRFRKKLD